jgi:putative transposase
MTADRMRAYESLKLALTTAPLLFHPNPTRPFKLYVDACFEGIGAALHQVQVVNDKELEGSICFISIKLKESKKKYGASQLECLCLVWELEKLYYYLDGCNFDVITDCVALKLLIATKAPRIHMMRWQIALQEWRGSMTIVHRDGAAHKNADGLSRWAFPNDNSNPAANLDLDTERDVPIMAISVSNLKDEFWDEVELSYESNANTACLLLILRSKVSRPDLVSTLVKIWKSHFEAGRFVLLDGLLYHCTNHNCALVVIAKDHIDCILSKCHNNVSAGHFTFEQTSDGVRSLTWWPSWSEEVEQYCKCCFRFQKANKATGKRYGLLQRIEEPTSRWEIVNMDFVTALPVVGKENFNSVLLVVDRFSKGARFLPCHKESSALDIALLFWQTIINNVGCPRIIISNRHLKFTSKFWQHLFDLLEPKLSFLTAYHPQMDGLAERMIQTLEDMLWRYCSFGTKFKDGEGYTRNWLSLLPSLEFTYNSSVHLTTGKTPFDLEKGWIPYMPRDAVLSRTVSLHPTAESFRTMMRNSEEKALDCKREAVEYNKERWDKSHREHDIAIGDLVLVSTLNFNNLEGNRKLKDSFVGPFVVKDFHGNNAVEVLLTKEFDQKHPTFPISLVKKFLKP